jgi:hypothetical protein
LEWHLGVVPSTVHKVAADALELSSSSRALLVGKLLDSLAGEVDPEVQRAHLEEIRRWRSNVRSGASRLIEGKDALRQARDALSGQS